MNRECECPLTAQLRKNNTLSFPEKANYLAGINYEKNK